MSTGWIKLHRKILDNAIFKNDKLFRVFMYLLLKAGHSEREQLLGDSIVQLKSGQWATGRKAISRDTGLTEQNVRTAITKLEKLGILTIKATSKYSIFSIANWDNYQQDNQQVTKYQPTSNQQVTTIKNVKNDKNDKNKDIVAKAPKFNFKSELVLQGVEPEIIEDWLTVRRKKKASNTKTAFKNLLTEISKANLTANEAVKIAAENSWAGFKANWYENTKPKVDSKDILQISANSDWHLQDQGF